MTFAQALIIAFIAGSIGISVQLLRFCTERRQLKQKERLARLEAKRGALQMVNSRLYGILQPYRSKIFHNHSPATLKDDMAYIRSHAVPEHVRELVLKWMKDLNNSDLPENEDLYQSIFAEIDRLIEDVE